MKRTKKKKSIISIIATIILPIFLVLLMLFVMVFGNLNKAREVAYAYMSNTAQLFIDDIKADIDKLYSEIYYRALDDTYLSIGLEKITVENANFEAINKIMEENAALRKRYGNEFKFFAYGRKSDFLVDDVKINYTGGFESELCSKLRQSLREMDDGRWEWELICVGDMYYLVSGLVGTETIYGYYIELELLLRDLELNNMGYQIIPYARWDGGEPISLQNYADTKIMEVLDRNTDGKALLLEETVERFKIANKLSIEMVLMPEEGILEDIVNMQIVLLMIFAGLLLTIVFGGSYLYLKLVCPIRQFIAGLQNAQLELFLNNTESFGVVELEMMSNEFSELLRRIRTLKMSVYEKELMAKQVQTEYMQEQLQSHFYLNCLSILHGMADKYKDRQMTQFLKKLSRYMGYVDDDSCKMKRIWEELEHIRDYVEIQQIRYNYGFSYEEDVDEGLEECLIPTMILQTFIENAIKHGFTLKRELIISLFITKELLDGEEYLYITISDTGEGFSESILETIAEERTIYYDGRKHIGISNTKKRLRLLFGDKSSMELSNMKNGYGAVIELTLPLIREEVIKDNRINFDDMGGYNEGIDSR